MDNETDETYTLCFLTVLRMTYNSRIYEYVIIFHFQSLTVGYKM